jgi:thymidylate synthase (FAD)
MNKVRLISYSKPADELEDSDFKNYWNFGFQDLITYCARVSNPTNQANSETSKGLLKYLMKEKHWSPFEMVSACLEVTTTRDIARQLLRHRSFSFQEFSQRYADPTKELNIDIIRDARLQDKKNRQNSIETDNVELHHEWADRQTEIGNLVKEHYKWAIDNGIAKEQARVILPEGNTESKLYVNGTLRSWMHYVELRTAPGTQQEHREVATMCGEKLQTIFPMMDNFIDKGI